MLNIGTFFTVALYGFLGFMGLLVLALGAFLIANIRKISRQKDEIVDLQKRVFEINAELEETNRELLTIEHGKTEFVSVVSHQLRAPITAIKGHASMLLENSYGEIAGSLKKPLEKILLSSERLTQIVADFLDLAKVEQGSMSYIFNPVDMARILTDLTEEFTPLAAKKGIEMTLQFSQKDSFVVHADESKIRQVLSNILDNSIKYTPKGKFSITLEKDSARGVVSVHITDTGIGLAQNDIYHIFGRFTRGAAGRKENAEGSGLGLYIAKKMIEAQRGKIWVDSAGPGKGSTFVVELPLE
jgi:signal transduction histidine kinase